MKNSKQKDLFPSTLLSEDTLANLSPSQAEKEVKKIQDISGQKCLGLSKKSNRLGLLEKTLVDTLNSVSTMLSKTWRAKVTPQGHLIFQHQASAHSTKGKGYGLLPTATKSDATVGGIIGKDDKFKVTKTGTLRKINRKGIDGSIGLARYAKMWPTPTVCRDSMYIDKSPNKHKRHSRGLASEAEHRKMWPSPRATDHFPGMGDYVNENKTGYTVTRKKTGRKFGAKLADAVDYEDKKTWPTPTSTDGQRGDAWNIKGWKKRKEKWAKKGVNLHKPLDVAVKLWPSPKVSDMHNAHMKKDEKGIPHDVKKGNLRGAVLWPTPRATKRAAYSEKPAPSMIKGKHGWSTTAAVTDSLSDNPHRNWPTPCHGDAHKNTKKWREGRQNSLTAHANKWPTPSRRDYKGGYIGGRFKDGKPYNTTLDTAAQYSDNKDKKKKSGQLNPTWVEWLMGYPINYTLLDVPNDTTYEGNVLEPGYWKVEPNVPRIDVDIPERIKRLKALGNSIVPQIAYNIGKSILDSYVVKLHPEEKCGDL